MGVTSVGWSSLLNPLGFRPATSPKSLVLLHLRMYPTSPSFVVCSVGSRFYAVADLFVSNQRMPNTPFHFHLQLESRDHSPKWLFARTLAAVNPTAWIKNSSLDSTSPFSESAATSLLLQVFHPQLASSDQWKARDAEHQSDLGKLSNHEKWNLDWPLEEADVKQIRLQSAEAQCRLVREGANCA